MQQRRGAPVEIVRGVAVVVVVVVGDRLGLEHIAFAVALVRGVTPALVGGRIDEQLKGDRQVAGVARGNRHDGGEVAASAVAAHRQA